MAYAKGLILIPARYNSYRLPGKALKDIAGKTMIRRTYERCALSGIRAMVVTDDKRIVNECLNHGIPVDLVTEPCKTGTDRVARCALRQHPPADWYINVQGDEPFANPEDILKVAHQMDTGDHREVVNGMSLIKNPDDLYNVTIPKVIAWDGLLKYMSRAPVPYPYGPTEELWKRSGYQQVCVYGFFLHHLKHFLKFEEKTYYESIEDIEILRFHETGIPVRMLVLQGSPLHVDTMEDLNRAQFIAKEHNA
jgi:3-deoxy-manno-octulosonate cytidylyltransferase (CMP-KDO synthetase)|tara:strand:+ start:744 stop:1496 length:753 start_codon:yes stop_codon:yes gene_type:complete